LRAGETTDARLGNVAVRLEKLTLPKSSDQRAEFVLALNTATSSINDLLLRIRERSPHNDTTPGWAQNWLAEIAVDECTVTSTAQFALYWMKEVNLVSDIIAESQGSKESDLDT